MEFDRRSIPRHATKPLSVALPLTSLQFERQPVASNPYPDSGLGVDAAPRYDAVAQSLHWVIALLIGVQLSLGLLAEHLSLGEAKVAMLARHKSAGMVVLVLVTARLGWRFIHAPPPLPDTLNKLERGLASSAHVALYGLSLALPLSGWLLSSTASHAMRVFGFISVPTLGGLDLALLTQLKRLHGLLALALGTIVLLHVAAALRHHFWLKDGILIRMLPRHSGNRLG